ncbi:glutathione S-transferase family protein [Nisaea sp.]|uniref:glutathione S-transferase family protein n=1 Tax=Nisaea sp. TaxID=2024842 RepID=UPI002B26C4AE|nr:glutathione S-transferase N-terminal domain-containing protein [Nisaea sp.]
MLQIYAIPVSLYSAKLRILLRHKELIWEEIPPPGGYGSMEYRQIVPAGNLPALRDGSLLLADSEAIAEYLNEVHPVPPLLPDTPAGRAIIRERSRYHDTRLEPAVRALFPYMPERKRSGFEAGRHADVLTDRLDGLGRLLEKAPPSEMLTLGDCGFPVTLCWLDLLIPLLGLSVDIPATVLEYRDGLYRHKAVAEEMAEYCPKLTAEMKLWEAE